MKANLEKTAAAAKTVESLRLELAQCQRELGELRQSEGARAEQMERVNLVLRRNTGYLTETTDLPRFLGGLLKETLELLAADGGHIFIYHKSDKSFSYAVGGTREDIHFSPTANEPGFFRGNFPAHKFPVFERLRAVRHAAILSRDGKDAPPPGEMMKWFQENGFVDAVCLVLTAGEMPVGFIGAVFRKQPDSSPQMMGIFHALANQAALAIHLSTLAEAAKESALSKERELAAKSKAAELEKEIQARRDSEHKLRQIVETIPALLWSTDSAGEPTYISQGLMEYCGQRGLEDVRNGRWETFVHPDDFPETVKSFNHSLQTGASHQVLQRLRRADGEFRWHYTRAEPMRDQQGRIIQWYGLSLDIHEGKQAQDELRDVLDSIPSVVWSAFPDGSNAYVNRVWVKYSGRPAEEMAGLGWQTAIHPDDLERHYATWLACIDSCEPSDDEARYLRADGKYRWHLRRATPLRDEKGNVVKWYGVLIDIEDRKTIEEALRSSEAYLAEAQRLSRTGSFGWNVAIGELVWSDETFCILGYDRNIKPTLELCFDRVHPEEKAFVKQTLDRAVSEASSLDFEHRLLMPDGAVKHVHVLAQPTKTDTGKLEFIGAVMDITERKKSAAALRASEHLARGQLDALVDTLAVLAREPKPLKFLEQVYSIICEQLGAVGLGTWEVAGDAGGIKRIANYEGRRLQRPTPDQIQVSPAPGKHPVWDELFANPEAFAYGRIAVNPLVAQFRLLPDGPWLDSLDAIAANPLMQSRLVHSAEMGVVGTLVVPSVVGGKVTGFYSIRFNQHREFRKEEIGLTRAMVGLGTLALQLLRLSEQGREAAVMSERNRMARDIHDTLAQGFTGVIMQLEAAKGAAARGDSGDTATHIERAGDLARSSLGEARRSVRALRPRSLSDGTLYMALEDMLKRMSNGIDLNAELRIEGEQRAIPPHWEEGLLRITQESLTNTIKHARARNFRVTLCLGAKEVRLQLVDDGLGFDPKEDHDGFGLVGMKERADQIGGGFILRSKPGQGTEILVTLGNPVATKSGDPNEQV